MAAAPAPAGPIIEGWDATSNPVNFNVTAPLRKAERNAANPNNHQVIRALQGFSVANGRPQVEFSVEIRARAGGSVSVGVITATSVINNANRFLGNDSLSWAYHGADGRIVHNNANVHANLRVAEAGAVVVVRLNCAANTVSFFLRGDQGLDPLGAPVPVTPNVELFPAVSLSHNRADVRLCYTSAAPRRALVAPVATLAELLQTYTRVKAALPPRQPVHVVVLGQVGNGKTALTQTILTAVRATGHIYWHDDLVTRPSADHVTKVVNKFAVDSEERKGDSEIHLWDTWGFMDRQALDFVDVFLPRILRGQLPPATKMPETADQLREMEANIGVAAPMHLPIVCISLKLFDNGRLKPDSLAIYTRVLQACRRHCYDRDPVVVLTHCDVTPDIAANPSLLWRDPVVTDAVWYLSSALQVQPTQIFPVALLYGRYPEPRDDVSSFALLPFLHALRLAGFQMESERGRAAGQGAGAGAR